MVSEMEKRKSNQKVKLSYIGHSLGSLYGRFVFGHLLEFYPHLWSKIEKLNFIALSSPHAGCSEDPLPIRLGGTIFCGQTGRELMLNDSFNNPFVLQLSLPGSSYMRALKQFKNLALYANTAYDTIVGYCTSSMRLLNPHQAMYVCCFFSATFQKIY